MVHPTHAYISGPSWAGPCNLVMHPQELLHQVVSLVQLQPKVSSHYCTCVVKHATLLNLFLDLRSFHHCVKSAGQRLHGKLAGMKPLQGQCAFAFIIL